MLETNITKVGGSLYVLIPDFLAKYFNLKSGDTVEIKIESDKVILIIRNPKYAVRR